MSRSLREREKLRERLLYFALVPAITVAVLLLGAAALRATIQIEKASQQSVFDATLSLAEERVDRLDKMIIAQDNAVAANVDVGALSTIARRWLPSAARETPSVRAVLVLDLDGPDHEVRAFVSRHPSRADDAFRRLLVQRLVPLMELRTAPEEQLRHLHRVVAGASYLVSYWQRSRRGRRYLVVAWHDVEQLVRDIMPQVYRDVDRTSRMNVIDQRGRILFGSPIQAGGFTVGMPFPTTLYNWRLQVALLSAEGLAQRAVRQRLVQLGVVGLAMLIAVGGVVMVVRAAVQERRLAALRNDFVANVSHELKTPLSSVRMFAELLLTRRVSSLEKEREYLQIIVGESERLSSLIDNVLDFAKLERGKDAYEMAPCEVDAVVRAAVEVLRYRAEREHLTLTLDIAPARTIADARAVELAVINLLDNALKYAHDSNSIDVRVSTHREEVCIDVSDQGPGIARAEQERIFDRFVRGDAAQNGRVRGSGIGLALVKHIADAHGGRISLQSPLPGSDRGTCFSLYLPLREQPAAAQ